MDSSLPLGICNEHDYVLKWENTNLSIKSCIRLDGIMSALMSISIFNFIINNC